MPRCIRSEGYSCRVISSGEKTTAARQRLRKASLLLQSSELSIEAVATRCGFANGSYLATVFAKTFGVTPLQYRRAPDAGRPSAPRRKTPNRAE